MESQVAVYCLGDPRTGDTCYVGRTSNLARRLKEHRGTDVNNKGKLLVAWIKKLRAKNLYPVMVVLQWTDDPALEEETIIRMKAEGHPLLNFMSKRMLSKLGTA